MVEMPRAAALLAAIAPWTPPALFHVGDDWSAAPRAAIAADGTSVVAWIGGPLLHAAWGRGGHFGARQVLGRWAAAVPAVAAAPGGRALVAWEGTRGIRVAVRTGVRGAWTVRTVARSNGDAINDVAVDRARGGGWFVAESEFLPGRPEGHFRVRTFTLSEEGRRTSKITRVDAGRFGSDAREVHVLGGSRLVYERELSSQIGVAAGSTRLLLGDAGPLSDPWVAPAPGGAALIAAIRNASCGDAGCTGGPFVWRVPATGPPQPLGGPALAHPGRALQPSVAPLSGGRAALVFLLKPHPEAFRSTGRVRAVVLGRDGRAGRQQALTTTDAAEPVLLPLSRGRLLAMWSNGSAIRGALAGPSGRFAPTAGPSGPPPSTFHTNPTNRDVRTAGSWAIVAWARKLLVRVSVRRFG